MKDLLNPTSVFNRYVKFYRVFFYILKTKEHPDPIHEMIILCEAWSWAESTETGWFYKSQSQWEREWGINRYYLRKAKERLAELRFLNHRHGYNRKLWFQANREEVLRSIDQYMRLNPKFFEERFSEKVSPLPEAIKEEKRREKEKNHPMKLVKTKKLGN